MSLALDNINSEYLLNIMKSNFDKDLYRKIRFLLSNMTLEVTLRGATTSSFTGNKGSPQGDKIIGILFNIYLKEAIRRARAKVIQNNSHIEHSYPIPKWRWSVYQKK